MILSLAFFVVTSILIFRTSRSNGYNPWFWTGMNFVIFIVVPFLIVVAVSFCAGILIGMEVLLEKTFYFWISILDWILFGLSIVGVFAIMKKISVINEEAQSEPPPDPGHFNLG